MFTENKGPDGCLPVIGSVGPSLLTNGGAVSIPKSPESLQLKALPTQGAHLRPQVDLREKGLVHASAEGVARSPHGLRRGDASERVVKLRRWTFHDCVLAQLGFPKVCPVVYFGEWVAEGKESGGVRTLVTDKVELRYYLEDDTAEVRVHHLTPQQDVLTPARPAQPTKILKRGPVAKNMAELNNASSLGSVGRPTLNLVGLRGGRAHLKDRRPQAPSSPVFLQPKDLVLGKTVDVAGRLLRLCECDSFTKNYFKNVYGIVPYSEHNLPFKETTHQHPVGYSYLDKQLGTPQLPRTEPLDPRWLEETPKDPLHPLPTTVTTTNHNAHSTRDGYEHTILRFGARLVTEKEKDREREFVINFYAHDSTVSVFEVPKINSGMRAGMFLGRGLVVSEKGGHVGGKDLYAGNIVRLNSHTFYITHADEFTLGFMEEHCDEFPQANYNVALDEARRHMGHHELTSLLHQLTGHDSSKSGYTRTAIVLNALAKALEKSALTRQQIQALVRRHRRQEPSPFSRESLTHLASLHLKRHNFDGLPDLSSGLRGRDTEGRGRLPAATVRAAVKATRLPVPTLLVDALVSSVTEHDGQIDYDRLCHELDYRQRPHIHDNLPCQLDESSLEVGLRRLSDDTDYVNLIADLEGSANTHHFAGSGLV
ncbi:putative EF-hand domain-containing family member C2 [Penaeus vannamei]|uniref:Putative EF-hand domain-containing family member C2 n=1 Tax=Penaeus vannamei TaxID=6689 RepID=A0A423TJM5_PENVA|nr:putative EF-hand domain-containing family member C2 [Penaeus vannamei]